MDLTIDAGNSTLSWALFEKSDFPVSPNKASSFNVPKPTFYGSTSWEEMDPNRVANEILAQEASIELITLSSVRPSAQKVLSLLMNALPAATQVVLDYACLQPILSYNYPAPETVGIDRWANATALKKWGPLPAVAVDLGSATTVSVVDGEGQFTGGWIAPGLDARILGLGSKAPHLPLPKRELPPPQSITLMGKNSAEATAAGVYLGYIGEINFYIRELKLLKPEPRNIVLTGGLAEVVYSYLQHYEKERKLEKIVVETGLTRAGVALLGQLVHKHKK